MGVRQVVVMVVLMLRVVVVLVLVLVLMLVVVMMVMLMLAIEMPVSTAFDFLSHQHPLHHTNSSCSAVDAWQQHGPGDVIRMSITREPLQDAQDDSETTAFISFQNLLSPGWCVCDHALLMT